jgi:16S rRNA (guanine527-N7)-methyltransferase
LTGNDFEMIIESQAKTILPSGTPGPESLQALAVHLRLLFEWNARYNLTAIRDPAEAVRRHTIEALEALPLVAARPADVLCDLGSGNGFPALPLLAALPDLAGVLFEAREARCAFLRAAIRESGLGARVRVEQVRLGGPDAIPPEATIVTLRGFPDPASWIDGAARREGVRTVLAWLARDDAGAIAATLGRGRIVPLRSHATGAILAVP